MSRLVRIWSFCGTVSVLTFFSSATFADVDLDWRPVSATVDSGEQVRLGLYAVSTMGSDQPILAVEVILEWDPVSVELLGLINDGPHGWLSSELPDDSMLDGLNDSLTDGDAYYRALAQFGGPAVATPEGLLVASFEFRALLPNPETTVAILVSAGSYTETAVWNAESADHNIVGSLGTARLTVRGCRGSDLDQDDDIDLADWSILQICFGGSGGPPSPECTSECSDIDADGDVDLSDWEIFAGNLLGPE